ncbi:MAG: type II toxin-antitoxin system RelE/ParE family toxin [Myxococcales bacterium]
MVEVFATDEFAGWYRDLDDAASEDVDVAVGLLESLGYPRSSAIEGASFALRELRIQSQGRPLRVFYAFDPKRQAVLLIGGDKTGNARFYDTMIPLAERLWKEYLDDLA